METQLVVGSWTAEPQSTQELQQSGVSDPQRWLVDAFGGNESWSGIRVNEHTVLSSGPVYQAVNVISSTLASLPIDVLEEKGGKKVKQKDHPAAQIWNKIGNDEMLPYSVRQTIIAQGLIHGNGMAVIHFEAGRPVGVFPLQAGTVWPDRIQRGDDAGDLIYRFITDSGTAGVLFPHEVFHFRLMGNGFWGISPLHLFSNTFGNGMAIEKFQGKGFANNARPSGVLQSDKILKPEARANLRNEWNDIHAGLDNSQKVAVLWDGITWNPMSVTNEQAQMLESRKFYREEVASIYNIPPHMLGAMENSAVRANIEEQNRAFVRQTLIPHDTSFTQESMEKLFTFSERQAGTTVQKTNFKALLRGDLQSRYNAYSTGRQWGWLSANDVLRLEDMDEIGEQGDTYLVPSNMADAETGEPFTAAQEPPPPVVVEDSETPEFLGFARQSLERVQSREVKALKNNVKSKKWSELNDKYYTTFSDRLIRPIQPLSIVNGFIPEDEMKMLCDGYVAQSIEELEGVTTESELLEVVAEWPSRITALIEGLKT